MKSKTNMNGFFLVFAILSVILSVVFIIEAITSDNLQYSIIGSILFLSGSIGLYVQQYFMNKSE